MSERRVMTEYGPGVVVASETVRGQTSYKVEGNGFSLWLTAQQVPEFGQLEWETTEDRTWDNSTTLPYNPEPQFPAYSTGESTIQPNQHVDPDKRTTPADSVTFEERPDDDEPGPSRDLFAASSIDSGDYSPLDIGSDPSQWEPDPVQPAAPVAPGTVPPPAVPQPGLGDGQDLAPRSTASQHQRYLDRFADVDLYDSGTDGSASWEIYHPIGTSTNWMWSVKVNGAPVAKSMALSLDDAYASVQGEIATYNSMGSGDGDGGYRSSSLDEIQARLDEDPRYARRAVASAVPEAPEARTSQYQRYLDRFADVDPVVDRTSLQARLDEDPARVVNDVKMANWENSEGLDEHTRQAFLLEEADSHVRTAAWADVRKKAIRLRRSGNIQLEAANPQAIVATVTGDHGIYDVAVIRGNILTGSSAITDWTCSCPWGDWAFERQHTFVGRLCSHAYAAFLELQSMNQRKDKPHGWNDKVSSRELHAALAEEIEAARYPREDGRLSTEPGTLTPDLHHIPKVRRLDRVDVQEDERVDIVRTSAIESIHPNGWGPEVESLLSKLKDLWAEENRPGRNQARIDEIRDVTDELRELGFDSSGVATAMRHAGIYDWNMEGFLQQAFLSEPFAGSGPVDDDGYSPSSAATAFVDYEDVDGPGNNPAEQNADDLMPRSAANEGEFHDGDFLDGEAAPGEDGYSDGTEGEGDVLAYLKEGGFGGGGGDSEFAAFQARLAAELEEEKQQEANLRTAGRKFTLAEQQALMDEQPADGQPLGLDELDLSNTHYLS